MSDAPKPYRTSWATSIAVTLVLLTLLAGAWFVPGWLRRRRAAQEREGVLGLATIANAEADFRANDRDRNGILDFWTGDVAGLYTYGLIPREIAEADAAPLVPLVPQPIPYQGHYYRALIADDSQSPPIDYRQVTDPKSGAVHNPQRFGFVVYPAKGLVPPKYVWIVNENNTCFHSTVAGPPPSRWPSDNQVMRFWSKVR
jgi:hypothetical protein